MKVAFLHDSGFLRTIRKFCIQNLETTYDVINLSLIWILVSFSIWWSGLDPLPFFYLQNNMFLAYSEIYGWAFLGLQSSNFLLSWLFLVSGYIGETSLLSTLSLSKHKNLALSETCKHVWCLSNFVSVEVYKPFMILPFV